MLRPEILTSQKLFATVPELTQIRPPDVRLPETLHAEYEFDIVPQLLPPNKPPILALPFTFPLEYVLLMMPLSFPLLHQVTISV